MLLQLYRHQDRRATSLQGLAALCLAAEFVMQVGAHNQCIITGKHDQSCMYVSNHLLRAHQILLPLQSIAVKLAPAGQAVCERGCIIGLPLWPDYKAGNTILS